MGPKKCWQKWPPSREETPAVALPPTGSTLPMPLRPLAEAARSPPPGGRRPSPRQWRGTAGRVRGKTWAGGAARDHRGVAGWRTPLTGSSPSEPGSARSVGPVALVGCPGCLAAGQVFLQQAAGPGRLGRERSDRGRAGDGAAVRPPGPGRQYPLACARTRPRAQAHSSPPAPTRTDEPETLPRDGARSAVPPGSLDAPSEKTRRCVPPATPPARPRYSRSKPSRWLRRGMVPSIAFRLLCDPWPIVEARCDGCDP